MKSLFAGRRIYYIHSVTDRHQPIMLGGQQVTLQHVETLRGDGVEAFVVTSESGISGLKTRLLSDGATEFMHMKQFLREINPEQDLVVLPGRFADRLDELPGEHKILFSQGIWITLNAISLNNKRTSPFQHPALRGLMVVSNGNAEIASLLNPSCPVVVVRNSVRTPANVDLASRHRTVLYPSLRRLEKNPWDTRAVLQVLRSRYEPGSCPRFIELENIPHDEVLKLMRQASVLLFLSTHEGLPLMPLEAMASGTLALGYDRPPISEVFHPRCLNRFGGIEGIVDALQSIIDEPAAWLDVRESNYRSMLQWSREAQAESIREAWKIILGNVPAGSPDK